MPNRIYCDRPGCEGAEPISSEQKGGTNRPTWKPGSLRTDELEVLLVDALADLWQESLTYRLAFESKLERAIYCATGRRGKVEIPTEASTVGRAHL